jgi:hypothetical protein
MVLVDSFPLIDSMASYQFALTLTLLPEEQEQERLAPFSCGKGLGMRAAQSDQ